ncbi:MAG TPA: hypothetical protein VK914_06800 [bacterium]|jgi:hypothetical protein|nr:hypothetical protein [bacterium]
MKRFPALRRIAGLAALALWAAGLHAVGLAQADSLAGLRSVHGPLRITWSVDSVSAKLAGGGPDLGDALGAAAFKRLKTAGVPMLDGSFDPSREPFVSLDLWTRGATKAEDASDPLRIFFFQFQVFAPAAALRGASKEKGRVEIWERSLYGVCDAQDIKDEVRIFLGLCGQFGADWKAAQGAGS